MKLRLLLLSTLLFAGYNPGARAQKIYLEGDTILMAANTRSTIVFPNDIRSVTFSPQEDYSSSLMGSSMTIQPNGKPQQAGLLTVIEGPKAETKAKTNRMHTFVMVYVADQKLRPSDLFHNYSSTKLISARMKTLSEQSSGVPPALPATPAPPPVTLKREAPAPARQLTDRPAAPEESKTDNSGGTLTVDGITISNEAIQKKALKNTGKFSECLQYLCQKHTPEEYTEGISSGLSYFISDTTWVAVSSLNNAEVKKRRIRRYLTGLTQSSYDKVEITWGDLQYVSNLVLNSDGKYHGQVQFTQTFRGYKDGIPQYSDRTDKNVEVILVVYRNLVNGEEKLKWNVLLGNIGVNETEKMD